MRVALRLQVGGGNGRRPVVPTITSSSQASPPHAECEVSPRDAQRRLALGRAPTQQRVRGSCGRYFVSDANDAGRARLKFESQQQEARRLRCVSLPLAKPKFGFCVPPAKPNFGLCVPPAKSKWRRLCHVIQNAKYGSIFHQPLFGS